MPDDGKSVDRPGGAFRVWPADAKGDRIDPPVAGGQPHAPNPGAKEATEIYFGLLRAGGAPPMEQVALQVEIGKVLRVVQHLYLDGSGKDERAFRKYYVRLFYLAQLGLEGGNAVPGAARAALEVVCTDLIADAGGMVKNAHLKKLGSYAMLYAIPFLLLYVIASLFPAMLDTVLAGLGVASRWLAGFSMLWVGCFTGVWLSYGIRKAKITLTDLVAGEEDRLLPQTRLLFAGLLTCAAGLMFALGIIDVRLGSVSLSEITRIPALAFLVGMFFGIGELALPASIGNKAGAMTSAVR